MPYYINPNDKVETPVEKEDDGIVKIGSQSGSLGTGGNAQKAPAVAKPSSSGSGPGFQNYAKANMGIAQGRLNNAAASNVSNQGRVAKSAIGQATTGFQQRMDAGSLANRENAVSDVSNITGAARTLNAAPKPPTPAVAPQADTLTAPVTSPGMSPLQPEKDAPTNPQPTQTPTTPVAPVIPEAPVVNPFGSLTDEQTNRFSDVINNKYKGPESLRQAGLYQLASGRVGTAQNTFNQAKTATGREDMLKNMYQQRGDYTTGQNKLDSALLNASKQGVTNLQNAATEQGNVEKQLDRAQIDSATQAQNRTNELQQIKNDAMKTFSQGKSDEEAATEFRLTEMTTKPVLDADGKPVMKVDGTPMTEWDKLPESFRNIIANKTANNAKMLADETAKVKGTNYDSISSQHAAAKAALATAKANNDNSSVYGMDTMSSMDGAGGTGIGSNAKSAQEIAAYQANAKTTYDNALASYNGLDTQLTGMDSQLAGLAQKYNPNAVVFNDMEADVLGVNSGEGLYNLGAGAIRSGVADNNKLISRDEQARQSVLAQLAGLDKANILDTNLKYKDVDKAGTQSALDALDLAETRRALNVGEQDFEDTANNTTLKGEGSKKVSRGNALGTTTRNYNASMEGNAGDFLRQGGYDFDKADENANMYGGKELLNAALQASKAGGNADTVEADNAKEQLGASTKGATNGMMAGPWGALVGSVLGNINQSGTYDAGQHVQSLLDGKLGGNNAFSNVHREARNATGDLAEGVLNTGTLGMTMLGGKNGIAQNVASAIRGVDTKAMAAMGNQVARENAAADLKNKYSTFLNNQGFDNRIGVENNATTTSRADTLKKLLANMDRTNTRV